MQERVFLDTSVLLRAAFRARSKTARLLRIPGIYLLTSAYAAEEARRNVTSCDQRERLAELLAMIDIRDDDVAPLPEWVILPEKDQPILQGAIAAGATCLLTDDKEHFGRYFWQTVEGITILPSSHYLKIRSL